MLICDLKLFTIDLLNSRFKLLNLQYMNENIPSPLEQSCLSSEGSLKQNSEEVKF